MTDLQIMFKMLTQSKTKFSVEYSETEVILYQDECIFVYNYTTEKLISPNLGNGWVLPPTQNDFLKAYINVTGKGMDMWSEEENKAITTITDILYPVLPKKP